jgi:hypothetical protein
MLALMNEHTRLEVEEYEGAVVVNLIGNYVDAALDGVALNREQVETLYIQLGNWLDYNNRFISDAV